MSVNTLRGRLFLSYLVLVGTVLLLVAGALLLLSLAPSTVNLRVLPTLQRLRAIGISVQREVGQRLAAPDSLEGKRQQLEETLAETAAAHDGVRLLLVNVQQRVVYDSATPSDWVGRRFPDLQRFSGIFADPRQDALAGRVRGPDGAVWLVYTQRLGAPAGAEDAAGPLQDAGRIQVVLAAPQRGGLAFFRANYLPALWRAALVALLLSVILALLISRSVARPLQRLAGATEAVAEGDYDQQLPLTGPDEIRRVSGGFNRMAARVKATQQAQRDFLTNVSHDLKTPLTSIQGWSQALVDGTATGPGEPQAAKIIQEEAERMARMVSELLALARIDSGQLQLSPEPLDLVALLEDVRRNLSRRAVEKDVELALVAETLPPLWADHDRLMQVFSNLVDNALSYTPAGGRVSLAAHRHRPNLVEVTVADNGAGIPPGDLDRIFERFYQVEKSRAQGGTRHGLGLAISRELVEAHGGEISVQSEPGRGALFRVRLPLRPPADGPA